MTQIINNYSEALTAGVDAATTTLTVSTAPAGITVSVANPLTLTLDDGTDIEVVRVTGITGNDLTVVRGVEGTAKVWGLGSVIECRLTNKTLLDMSLESGITNTMYMTSVFPPGPYTYKFAPASAYADIAVPTSLHTSSVLRHDGRNYMLQYAATPGPYYLTEISLLGDTLDNVIPILGTTTSRRPLAAYFDDSGSFFVSWLQGAYLTKHDAVTGAHLATVTLPSEPNNTQGMVRVGSKVYTFLGSDGGFYTLDLDGSNPTLISSGYSTSPTFPWMLLTDGIKLYSMRTASSFTWLSFGEVNLITGVSTDLFGTKVNGSQRGVRGGYVFGDQYIFFANRKYFTYIPDVKSTLTATNLKHLAAVGDKVSSGGTMGKVVSHVDDANITVEGSWADGLITRTTQEDDHIEKQGGLNVWRS